MTRITPGMPGAVVRPSNEVYRDEDGQWRTRNHITVPPEIFEQYRTGYRCLVCNTVQDEPFPEVCKEVYRASGDFPETRCGFPIRAEQTQRLQFEFRGEITLWPEPDDDLEREEFQRRTGVWLPNDE